MIKIIQGDWVEKMREMPSASVHTCVTSPPYWNLRDYGVEGQLGLEKTPEEYVSKLVAGFREVRRVLRDDGTLWLNLGDSYARLPSKGQKFEGGTFVGSDTNGARTDVRTYIPPGLKEKDLVGIPWRVAFALQADGWYLRSDIIWHKPNPMPESVTDRPTKAHEYIFLLTKRERYYYDNEAVKEAMTGDPQCRDRNGEGYNAALGDGRARFRPGARTYGESGTRNRRTVWTVPSQAYSDFGNDFSAADYVDRRGIPHKWSPDCPVHERDGRLRQGNRATVSCGGLGASIAIGNERSNAGPDEKRHLSASPSDNCKSSTGADSPSCVRQKSTPGSKTHGDELRMEEAEESSRSRGTRPQRDPSKTDSGLQPCVSAATSRSTGTRKSVPACPISLDGIACEETLSHKQSKQQVASLNAPGESTPGSNRDQGSDLLILGVEISSRKIDSHSYTQAKCTCTVCQVSHFATFPEDLIKPCILAGTSAKGCCVNCGAPWERITQTDYVHHKKWFGDKQDARHSRGSAGQSYNEPIGSRTVGWKNNCECKDAATVPCTVLDPFGGSGTTGQVALELGRNAILIELNPKYIDLIQNRTNVTPGLQLA